MGVAQSIWVLMLGRIFVGIGVGIAAQIVPLYLSEIAPTEIRGKLIAMNTAMITVGQLISVLIVLLLIPSWRWMLGLAAIPSVLQFIGVLLLPESPRWLVKEGRTDEAKQVISSLYYPEYTELKMTELEQEAEKLKIESALSETERLRNLFTSYRRCLIIGCGVQAS